jgi:wyosine [tRNA(Phe)-imidazoG37] synthetase (radical SAM superfamily)
MKVFGPVPSRRLGQSVGINNIPPKICSYACSYCQVGKSLLMTVERSYFYTPLEIAVEVAEKVYKAREFNEPIDYLTFVPDGEPTLDINLGKIIELLRPLDIKIAVITNGSLLWREDVRNDLEKADLVSVKVDAVDMGIWREINHAHKKLDFSTVLDGVVSFAESFPGKLITETMLIKGVNDNINHIKDLAEFVSLINPHMAYLAIPIRPPAFSMVEPANEAAINRSFQIFNKALPNVEYLIGYEGNAFAFTGNVKEDILSITAVHPMRDDAMGSYLLKAHSDNRPLEELIASGKLKETRYENHTFYVRKLKKGIEV